MQTQAKASEAIHVNHFSITNTIMIGDSASICDAFILVDYGNVITLIDFFPVFIEQTSESTNGIMIYIIISYTLACRISFISGNMEYLFSSILTRFPYNHSLPKIFTPLNLIIPISYLLSVSRRDSVKPYQKLFWRMIAA